MGEAALEFELMSEHTIDILLQAEGWKKAIFDYEAMCKEAVEAALTGAGVSEVTQVELSIMLADDDTMQDLNNRFRNKDKPTNVLSFSDKEITAPAEMVGRLNTQGGFIGDIALGLETVLQEAEAQGKAPRDHATHLLVHGVLHLFGYDHEEEGDAEGMEALEIEVLARLGIANPYNEGEA